MKQKWFRALFRRRVIIILLLLFQAAFLIYLVFNGSQISRLLSRILSILSLLVVLYIVSRKDKGAYKTTWVFLILSMKSLGGSDSGKKAEKPVVAEEKAVEKIDFSNVKIEPLFEETVDFETFSKSDFRAVKIEACEAVPKSKKLLKFTLNDGTDRKRTILSGIHEYYEPEDLIGKTAIAIVNLPPRKMMGIDSEGMLISAVHEEDGQEGLNLLMVDDRIPAGAKLY